MLVLALLTGCDQEPIRVSEAAETPDGASTSRPSGVRFDAMEEPLHRELAEGLVIETLARGRGDLRSRVGDRLTVHYAGFVQETGEEFESSRKSGIPFRFRLGDKRVVEAWERGLEGVRAGSTVRIQAPSKLAHGSRPWSQVPTEADLAFEIEVIRIER